MTVTGYRLLLLFLLLPIVSLAQPDPWESDMVQVTFVPEAHIHLLQGGEPLDLAGNATDGVEVVLDPLTWHHWQPLVDLPPEELDRLHDEGEAASGEDLFRLGNVVWLRFDPGLDPWLDPVSLAADFELLPGVMRAAPVPLPQEPPTPDFEWQQGYLWSATNIPAGIDAQYAWNFPGGDAAGVTICDIEYSWNEFHDDLTKLLGSQINWNNPWDPFNDNNHGTAVAGELVADQNGWGTTGIAKGANILTCAAAYGVPTPWWNPAGAITLAISMLQPGDIILLEQQWDLSYPNQYGWFVPVEWYMDGIGGQTPNAVYAAIQTAVANGISVVEAGGNGNMDLDLYAWFGDSGATIVGAGGAQMANDRERLSFSSYGTRFDVQGWGEQVVTTGYGDLWNSEGTNRWFTSTFNGTSSASPIVAGAAAICTGYWLANVPQPLPQPQYFRTLLASTGRPQVFGPAGWIGPRPDLQTALGQLAGLVPWTDVTPAILGSQPNSIGCAWGDYDNDGDQDLYVTYFAQPNILLRNDLGTWTSIPGPVNDIGPSWEPLFCDPDADGFLDLYFANGSLGNRLLQGNGTGTFIDVTPPPLFGLGTTNSVACADLVGNAANDFYLGNGGGIPNQIVANDILAGMYFDLPIPPLDDPGDCWDAAWCDYDRDGDQDVFLANQNGPSFLFEHLHPGLFIDVTPPAVMGAQPVATGAAWGDCDNDGDFDLYVTMYGAPDFLLRNDGPVGFTDISTAPVSSLAQSMGCTWGDYDNDGDLDLFRAEYGQNTLLQNLGGGVMADDTRGLVADPLANNHGTAWCDHDNDGDLDLFMTNFAGAPRLLRNDWGFAGNWIEVDLVGAAHNTDATGTVVRVVAGGVQHIRQVAVGEGHAAYGPRRLHFGLGSAAMVDTLEIDWPTGGLETHVGLTAPGFYQFIQAPVVAVEDDAADLPSITRLAGAAPNPFNPQTEIRFDLAQAGNVQLAIYGIDGRRITTLVDEPREAGRHGAVWRGTDATGRRVASGTYIARLEADGRSFTTRVTVVK